MVAFLSRANNLHSVDANAASDVFYRNIADRTTRLVSINPAGTASGNDAPFEPQISADGSTIVFFSRAANLVAGDFNTSLDVFSVVFLNRSCRPATTSFHFPDRAGLDSSTCNRRMEPGSPLRLPPTPAWLCPPAYNSPSASSIS